MREIDAIALKVGDFARWMGAADAADRAELGRVLRLMAFKGELDLIRRMMGELYAVLREPELSEAGRVFQAMVDTDGLMRPLGESLTDLEAMTDDEISEVSTIIRQSATPGDRVQLHRLADCILAGLPSFGATDGGKA